MKHTVLILFLAFSFGMLRAQEADTVLYDTEPETETVVEEESADYSDYEDDEESEETTHTLIEPGELSKTHEYSAEKIPVRKFDRDKWKQIVGKTNYNEKPEKEKEEAKEEEEEDSTAPPVTTPWKSDGLRIVAYGIIIAFVAFILYYIFKNVSLENKLNRKKIQAEDLAAPVENIEELDIHTLLRQTLAEGNFRLAVRMYFLGLLKKLNEGGVIVWKKDKTNRDYLTELFSKDYFFDDIRKLTLAYELVWYGEHVLSKESYEKLFAEFETIDQKLNTLQAS